MKRHSAVWRKVGARVQSAFDFTAATVVRLWSLKPSPMVRATSALLLLAVLFTAPRICRGGAFSIPEMGAKATGMGTAFIAVADDGSALFYNPAGIAFQKGTYFEMDNTVVVGLFRFTPSSVPQGTVVPSNGYSGIVKPHFIPVAALYFTHQLSEKYTFGFGMFTPFGLAANFTNFHDGDPASSKFVGRYAGSRGRLESYWFQPTLAYKITPNSAIAVGPAFVHTHLQIERSFLNPQDDALTFGRQAASTIFPGVNQEQAAAVIARLLPEGRARIAATGNAPAVAAGYLYKNAKMKTNFGASYRSATNYHLKGAASFAFGNQSYALQSYIGTNFLTNAFPNQSLTGNFVLPATYGVGFANSSFFNTTFAADFRFQDYHRFVSLPLDFGINEKNTKDVAVPAEQRFVFNFRNGYDLAIGASHPLNSKTEIRVGYLFARSPVPDMSVGPLFPDSSRDSFTFGGTRKSGNLDLTFFYEAEFFRDRVTNVAANANQYTNGDYNNFAHIFGLSIRLNATEYRAQKKQKH